MWFSDQVEEEVVLLVALDVDVEWERSSNFELNASQSIGREFGGEDEKVSKKDGRRLGRISFCSCCPNDWNGVFTVDKSVAGS